jgi:hypothetical protein
MILLITAMPKYKHGTPMSYLASVFFVQNSKCPICFQQQVDCWNYVEMFLQQQVHLLLNMVPEKHHLPVQDGQMLQV